MDDASGLLITVTGTDRPGITAQVFGLIDEHGGRVIDVEQVVIRERLVLGILLSPNDPDKLAVALASLADELGVEISCEPASVGNAGESGPRHFVTVVGQPLRTGAIAELAGEMARLNGNIEQITRLSRYPVQSFEFLVSGADGETLRAALSNEAAQQHIDVAVQPATLYRRAKRLVCLDVDSTLLQGEAIERIADLAGCGEQVRRVTSEAMSGALEFGDSLRARVAMLEGLEVAHLRECVERLRLTPGAKTLVRTLKRLGFQVAIVSGGFTQVTDWLTERLSIDYAAANTLEVDHGQLTGRVVGHVVDRTAKARLLENFADQAGVPLSQTVAIGDGANDVDMLGSAGLGIAFNAKTPAREAADTSLNVPYLDAILFLLGITREEIEAADAADPLAPIDDSGEAQMLHGSF
jgi:phosphoserine phosphatase